MSHPEPEATGHRITGLLREAAGGHRGALDEVLPLVYDELSAMAHRRLRQESPGHTLETAGLVHEAWLRLIDQHRVEWQDRRHFYGVASQAMRRILVDHARARQAEKRGDGAVHLDIDGLSELVGQHDREAEDSDHLLALDASLTEFSRFAPEGARVVQLRFFGGLTNAEVADVTASSERSVRRAWTAARAWLRRDIRVRLAGGAT